MSDNAAFLQAILDNPDDDTPRLMFADWLMERADPHGEFIKIQCELARLTPTDERYFDLRQREAALLAEHGDDWAKRVAAIATNHEFERGFVGKVSLGARKLLTHGAKLFALAPIRRLRLIRLGSSGVTPEEVAACPLLARLRGLELIGRLDAEQMQTLLKSPHLAQIVSLGVPSPEFRLGGLQALFDGALPCLEELDLTALPWASHVVRDMARPKSLPFPLRKLNLTFSGIGPLGVEALARAPGLAELAELTLNSNTINNAGGQALAESKYLTNLTALRLHGCRIGVKGTQALAASTNVAKLSVLDLSSNGIADNGVRALVESPHLTRLRELNLGGDNGLHVAAIEELAGWTGLGRLTRLQVAGNQELGDEGIRVLAGSPHLSGLRCLDVSDSALSSAGVAALAEAPGLTGLWSLDLHGNWAVDDAGAVALARSKTLSELRELDLSATDVRDGGARALLESKHLTRLVKLNLMGARLKAETKKAVHKRFGPEAC
jgi:uncharacterized protein (TIGR02996 family)